MIRSELFTNAQEVDRNEAFYRQNSKLLKVELSHGPVQALTGSMVAYQGNARFTRKGSGGVKEYFKRNITGQVDNLMFVEGNGEVFFGHGNADVQVLYLENDSVIVNSANLLAFSDSLSTDITRIQTPASYLAGGLWNTRISGTGYVAILTAGVPFSLKVEEAPTFADPEAVVLWTPGVRTDIRIDNGGLKSIIRGGTGESIQMSFSGQGIVVCQSSEMITRAEEASQA